MRPRRWFGVKRSWLFEADCAWSLPREDNALQGRLRVDRPRLSTRLARTSGLNLFGEVIRDTMGALSLFSDLHHAVWSKRITTIPISRDVVLKDLSTALESLAFSRFLHGYPFLA